VQPLTHEIRLEIFHRALLQKRPMILSILLTGASPYEHYMISFCATAHARDQTKISGSTRPPDFWVDLSSDGNSVYSLENLFENLGTPVKTCLIFTGTPVKT